MILQAKPNKRVFLVSGSRKQVSKLLQGYVEEAVKNVATNGHFREIVVGDAQGIDEIVVKAAERYKFPVRCFGLFPKPRNGISVNPNYRYIQLERGISYFDRDKYMVSQADDGLFAWNGIVEKKPSGTIRAYMCMRRTPNKRALLVRDMRLANFIKDIDNDIVDLLYPDFDWSK